MQLTPDHGTDRLGSASAGTCLVSRSRKSATSEMAPYSALFAATFVIAPELDRSRVWDFGMLGVSGRC